MEVRPTDPNRLTPLAKRTYFWPARDHASRHARLVLDASRLPATGRPHRRASATDGGGPAVSPTELPIEPGDLEAVVEQPPSPIGRETLERKPQKQTKNQQKDLQKTAEKKS